LKTAAHTGVKADIPPRERILDAARDLFYSRGIRCVSVDEIAAAAQTNKMTLYRHFGSKDELVAAYLSELARDGDAVWETLAQAYPGDPHAQLEGWVQHVEAIFAGRVDRGEPGVEIFAQPPGKKLQSVNLLSGGEKALTAVSLIFAIFLIKPTPFCLLDEVDAPLDDANVERFCNLLEEMARLTDTRFLVITHNPITMARMNRLYGVTMAERGVSQLVSVDLEGAVKLREAV